ncbi:hypothetical protein N0V83_010134 [Neocucurbitaria cava]|uniref:Heterokaryon incompatibility domain-containing protein n=1 Tax=Neocucurbitaria cava TaxID=798079 RepID=A0A9W8XYD4_9PLEO|nr:hypothetical protein N0V83_010134 [Neocucurbitaria cava]
MRLEKVKESTLDFQALSYAWGDDEPSYGLLLSDISRSNEGRPGKDTIEGTIYPMDYRFFSVRSNLYQALKRIRRSESCSWIWVDALCIDQTNESETSQQIPMMPDIYYNAWNVIAWLGEEEDGMKEGVDMVPNILNLRILDYALRGEVLDEDILRSWGPFAKLLRRPWFERRWVIQEVAGARRPSVRIGEHILSWVDFADAVELYSDKIDLVQELLSRSYHSHAIRKLGKTESFRAMALIDLSRKVFRKSSDCRVLARLMTLESLVLTTSSFAASQPKDVVYALLYLAHDTSSRRSLTKLNERGDLLSSNLITDKKQPSTVKEYLERVQVATENRQIFRCEAVCPPFNPSAVQQEDETVIGMGLKHIKEGPVVVSLQHCPDIMSPYKDGLHPAIDPAVRQRPSPKANVKVQAYKLLSSDKHTLLYASTDTSERNDGAANNCTLMRPLVTVSSAAAKPTTKANRVVVKGKLRIVAPATFSIQQVEVEEREVESWVGIADVDSHRSQVQDQDSAGRKSGWTAPVTTDVRAWGASGRFCWLASPRTTMHCLVMLAASGIGAVGHVRALLTSTGTSNK